MGVVEDIYEDLDTDVSFEEFQEAVDAKVEQMGGLADEETAAMLIAHELQDDEVNGIADIDPGMEEVKFLGKVVSIGELRTFERDGEDEEGRVINVEVADETGRVRVSFWDEQAQAAANGELEVGQVLRILGRPKEGYNGVEVSVDKAEPDDDVDIDVQVMDTYTVEALSLGLSDVNLRGKILDTDSIRTFSRDDGSEGRVANLTLGDETGRIRVTLWDERTSLVEAFSPGTSVEVIDGYVKERNGNLELHVGNRGAIEEIDEEVEYVPETADVADLEIGDTVDLMGVVRSADPKREFDRKDGSKGQVRNIRIQDKTGDIRIALWGEKADKNLAPGDTVQLADIEIQDGWQDDIEGSAGWRSSVTVVDGSGRAAEPDEDEPGTGLSAFADTDAGNGGKNETDGADGTDQSDTNSESGSSSVDTTVASTDDGAEIEFTGTVVQAGSPVVLDNGDETLSVDTDADVHLGQQVTARGRLRDGRLDAEDLF